MVVMGSPLRDFVSCIRKAQEPVLIETADPKLAVEALDERILRRLAHSGNLTLPVDRFLGRRSPKLKGITQHQWRFLYRQSSCGCWVTGMISVVAPLLAWFSLPQ